MNDEISKRPPVPYAGKAKIDFAARGRKIAATKAAKKAAKLAEQDRGNVTREHKVVDEPEAPVSAAREGSRLNPRTGRVEAVGRDGEVLSRTQQHVSDEFEIPKSEWPAGWDYQWNTMSVHGNQDIVIGQYNHMQAQGWRAVPAERHAGKFLPKNAKGAIIKKGMILEERPTTLGDEARREDQLAAKRLISDRNESLKLTGVQKSLPDGFAARNDVSGIRMQIDKSLDVVEINKQAGNYSVEK